MDNVHIIINPAALAAEARHAVRRPWSVRALIVRPLLWVCGRLIATTDHILGWCARIDPDSE